MQPLKKIVFHINTLIKIYYVYLQPEINNF